MARLESLQNAIELAYGHIADSLPCSCTHFLSKHYKVVFHTELITMFLYICVIVDFIEMCSCRLRSLKCSLASWV